MRMTREQAAVKLDIDDCPGDPPMDNVNRLLGRAGYTAKEIVIERSPSGKGWHVILYLMPRPRCPFEVVALQAILGGDVNREALQLARARAFPKVPKFMREAWNVLYAPHKHRQRLSLRRHDAPET